MHRKMLIELPFFPSTSFFQLVNQYEEVVLEKFENFQKQTHRNRTTLLSSQGNITICIPIGKEGRSKYISKVVLPLDDSWKLNHLKTIATCYESSPFYAHYIDELKCLYDKDCRLLWDFSLKMFLFLLQKLGLDVHVSYTETYVYPQALPHDIDDYRYFFKSSIKKNNSFIPFKPYQQVFSAVFIPNLSSLDLLFNLGPESRTVLQ